MSSNSRAGHFEGWLPGPLAATRTVALSNAPRIAGPWPRGRPTPNPSPLSPLSSHGPKWQNGFSSSRPGPSGGSGL